MAVNHEFYEFLEVVAESGGLKDIETFYTKLYDLKKLLVIVHSADFAPEDELDTILEFLNNKELIKKVA